MLNNKLNARAFEHIIYFSYCQHYLLMLTITCKILKTIKIIKAIYNIYLGELKLNSVEIRPESITASRGTS